MSSLPLQPRISRLRGRDAFEEMAGVHRNRTDLRRCSRRTLGLKPRRSTRNPFTPAGSLPQTRRTVPIGDRTHRYQGRIIAESDPRFKSPRQVPLECQRNLVSLVSTRLRSLKYVRRPPSELVSWLQPRRLGPEETRQVRLNHGLHHAVGSIAARFRRSSIGEPDC